MANKRLSKEKQVYVLAALSEGTPINAVCRMFKVGKHAVLRVIEETGEALADYISLDSDQLPHEKLSDREYQTLCMLGSGKRLTDIARVLSLSVKTVSVYRTRLLEKMGLANNAELTYYVMSNHLVDLNVPSL